MRNKTRFQYVDEFRKINCIQKLFPIENLHPDDKEDAKQDNNKFIRYKEEVVPENQPAHPDYLYNDIITSYKADIELGCADNFDNKNTNITNDIEYYRKWSESLNKEIKVRDYRHKFYFKEAHPPPRLKEEPASSRSNDDITSNRNENPHEDTNIQLPQKGKYNFAQITKHLYINNIDHQDKDNIFLRDLTIKNEIGELRKLKNLQQIERIGQFYEQFNKFSYYIEPPQDQTEIQFVDNSIVRGNNTLTIDYFRDIGTPSRRILEYTISKEKKMKNREDDEAADLQNDYTQQNRELLYLYFLKEDELKINKNDITFFDMTNMSMGRITCKNVHMCVRNEKVTKAQYTKLLKKMEKCDLRENQAGKPKENKEVGTEELEEMNIHSKGEQDSEVKEDKTNVEKIIEEINKIRKEVKFLEEKSSNNNFNRANFNNQIYMKLQQLLYLLYQMITDKMTQKYPLSQIGQHLHEIQGTNDLGYDRLRILWFVVNCYDEMVSKQQKTIDLRNIADNKPKAAALLTRYKGTKVMAQDLIQSKKVYGFNIKQDIKKKQNNRSKSPIDFNTRAPIKSNLNKSHIHKTPTKHLGNTGSKLNTSAKQSATKKYAFTAKK